MKERNALFFFFFFAVIIGVAQTGRKLDSTGSLWDSLVQTYS